MTFRLTPRARQVFRDKRRRVRVRRAARRGVKRFRVRAVPGLRRTGARVTVGGWSGPAHSRVAVTRTGKVR